MEFFLLYIAVISVCSGLCGGWLARAIGRNFWLWLLISCMLPVVSCCVLVCLPSKEKPGKSRQRKAVENDELFNHLFDEQTKKIQRA